MPPIWQAGAGRSETRLLHHLNINNDGYASPTMPAMELTPKS